MHKHNNTIAFIGAGKMATSIFGGLIKQGWPANRIRATARTPEKLAQLHQQFGIHTTDNNAEAVADADIVMLCVKPAVMKPVLTDLAPALTARQHLVISVAAGITLESLTQWSSRQLPIIRSMPNTPSLLGQGACGLFANALVSNEHRALATTIFEAVGVVQWVEKEHLIDVVTALSGSGPAYYFLFMEYMVTIGEQMGLDSETAYKLALQTALGAATMAVQSDMDVAELRRRVCSPGGTTEQAIRSFQDDGLEKLIKHAMNAAAERAAEMATELGN